MAVGFGFFVLTLLLVGLSHSENLSSRPSSSPQQGTIDLPFFHKTTTKPLRLTTPGTTLFPAPTTTSSSSGNNNNQTGLSRQQGGNIVSVPVLGDISPYGVFWSTMYFGTPPVPMNVSLDTGSNLLFVSLKDCKGCGRHSPGTTWYSPSASATSQPYHCKPTTSQSTTPPCPRPSPNSCVRDQCHFNVTYGTCDLKNLSAACSIAGPLFRDVVGIGGLFTEHPFPFGGIASQTSDFSQFQHIHGIVGLISSDNFGLHKPNIIDQLAMEHKLKSNNFALCFKSNQGGHLTVGGSDSAYQIEKFQYTPNAERGWPSPHFFVTVKGFYADGVNLGAPSSNYTGIDTGTNLLVLSDVYYTALQKYIEKTMCHKVAGVCPGASKSLFNGHCFHYSRKDLKEFPPIQFKLEGEKQPNGKTSDVTLEMHPRDYLVHKAHHGHSVRCWGITKGSVSSTLNIIGDTLMTHYYVEYDLAQNRLGWARVNKTACFGQRL
eukprot:TRINITY_DN66947_c8_g1_i1.p1 TRINITY_DN66947_c8_g1~~TRINITY_DN66947_c8_g1_i1.p1  ORF type:complete len:488 (+),score=52.97 TRINITY_DN66947_c8_g1_i1:30-1493(+)